MKILIFINQKNYFEEILIQIIFTFQATGYSIYIDPIYSIIINCAFIIGFIYFAKYHSKATIFRIWYHHHLRLVLPVLISNQSDDLLSWINIIMIITQSILFLAYTQILTDIQIFTYLKNLKFIILIVAFSIHHLSPLIYILLIVIQDIMIFLQSFFLVIPCSQKLLIFQILSLLSINRIAAIIIVFYGSYLELFFLLPVILVVSIKFFNLFLHHQICLAIAQQPFNLQQISIITFTYQLGVYPGLFYLSQILVTHSKDCTRPNCFCISSVELLEAETWTTPEQNLEKSLNQVLSEIIRLYNFNEMKSNQEYVKILFSQLLLLSRIETQYKEDRLFETLLRSKRLNQSSCFGYRFFPYQFRIEGHRKLFYSKLQEKVEGVRINSLIYYTYCNLVEQLGQLVVKLLLQRQYIFWMLTLQYQNPLYYLFHSQLGQYINSVKLCELLLDKIMNLNSQSLVSQHLMFVIYSIITFQPEKQEKMKNHNLSLSISLDPLWNVLNDRQCCYVQCKYDNGLVMLNHSVLFTKIIEENGIKSEYIGQYIEKLIAGPAKERHQQFLNRLIQEGKPRLLNTGIQKFFIATNKGFMKQIDSLVRLGQSMENLTFMTIMGYKQEDTCGKILLSLEGNMYSYCEIAAQMLKLGVIQFKHNSKKLDINFKLCIPITDKDEVHNGFILIPKVSVAQHETPQKTISTRSVRQVAYYKYFLKHPKQCLICVSTYQFCESSYDEGKCRFETLYLYYCTQIRDLELKMMALEIMLKQVMMINNITTESYVTSYTTFKSIIPSVHNNNKNQNIPEHLTSSSQKEDHELDDHNFELSNESCHIQQDPQTIFVSPFISNENQLINGTTFEQSRDQKFNQQSNYSSIIANSSVTQDFLLSSRRGQDDLSARDTARENQQLIQLNLNNTESLAHQQKMHGDMDEEIESPAEMQQVIEMQISVQDLTSQNANEQIEWIKKQVKQFKHSSEKRATQETKPKQKVKEIQFTFLKQSSSVTSTESQKGLINHIVNGMIQSSPHQIYSLSIIGLIYILCLIIIIILSLQQWKGDLELFFLESRGGQFSISLLQSVNLMEIAIQILSTQNNFTVLNYYMKQSANDYVNYCEQINYLQNTNYDFLQQLETEDLVIRRSFQNSYSSITSSSLQGRHFLIDILAYIYLANCEIIDFKNSSFNIMGFQESYFTLNYPLFFNLSTTLITSVNLKLQRNSQTFLDVTIVYVVSGLFSCILIIMAIILALIQVLKWRATIVRTFFLFQNLQQYIEEQEIETIRLFEIDEFKHLKYNSGKIDKDKSQRIKLDQRYQDNALKKRFLTKQLILIICLATLELAYFIPYKVLSQEHINELLKFQLEINQLGLSQLAFSNRLTYFVQQYANSQNNVNIDIFNNYDEFLSNYEDSYLYQLPYDESVISQLTNLVNGNICELNQNSTLNNYNYSCPFVLQDGYAKFAVQAYNQLIELRSVYPDFSKGISQLLSDRDFREIIISYGYIFPLFLINRDALFTRQQNENTNNYTQAIIIAVLVLMGIIFVFGILIYIIIKQCYQIIIVVKQSLLIFSKQCLSRNKHLVQILSKEVTID